DQKRNCRGSISQMSRWSSSGHHRRKLSRQQRSRSPDHSPSNVRGEAFARSTKMSRIHSRQIISPEAQLRNREQSREEDSPLEQSEIVHRGIQENQRNNNQSGDLKHSEQPAARDDSNSQKREQKPAKQTSKFLERLNSGNGTLNDLLTLRLRRARINLNQSRDDLRKLLNR